MNAIKQSSINTLLNICHNELTTGNFKKGFTLLTEGLTDLRLASSDNEWHSDIRPRCKCHPLSTLLQEDPYTRRAVIKPRGYAGDAVMMDYVYFRNPPEGCSPLGKKIFKAVTSSANGASVRWRRQYIAKLISNMAIPGKAFSALSVACGHLREGLLLKDETTNTLARFVAIDHDLDSLKEVSDSLPFPVTALNISALNIDALRLVNQPELKDFDLIYTAGLYDYLNDDQAISLTHCLFDKVASGGTLLIANFTPDNSGRGYMEAFMDWELVLRNKDGMRKLIPASHTGDTYMHFDPFRNVIYLHITKA